MPKYNPAYDEQEYDDVDDQQDALKTDEEESEGEKALISKAVLGGKECKVGDTITLKVTAVYDDEIQAEVHGYKEDESETEEASEEMEETEPEETVSEDKDEAMPEVPQAAYD